MILLSSKTVYAVYTLDILRENGNQTISEQTGISKTYLQQISVGLKMPH